MLAKLATASGVIAASAPPAIMMSAWSCRMISRASPTLWADDAQADTVQ